MLLNKRMFGLMVGNLTGPVVRLNPDQDAQKLLRSLYLFCWLVSEARSDRCMFIKSVVMGLLLLVSAGIWQDWWTDFSHIATVNAYLDQANAAYNAKKYRQAASAYTYLVDSLHEEDPKVILQCGHAWFYTGHQRMAYQYYSRLVQNQNKPIQSVAWQQLGFMQAKRPVKALAYFRNALHANPGNEVARYNYEMLKLLYPEADPIRRPERQQNQPPSMQEQVSQKLKATKKGAQGGAQKGQGQEAGQGNEGQQGDGSNNGQLNKPKDGKEADQQNKAKQEAQGQNQRQNKADQKGEEKAPDGRKPEALQGNKDELDKLKMSSEQAKALLDAMKNGEVQYLQQKRYPKSGKSKATDKPNW